MPNEAAESRRISVSDIQGQKGGRPIVCLTAYSKPMAQWLDPYVDLLLVGDSLAMVIYGMETTRGITLDAMINHGVAVMRGSDHACVIVDLPHGTYEDSPGQAYASASRVMEETRVQGVKLEGGAEMGATIKHLVDQGIPVLGHIGLLPQKAENRGGFKIQGKDDEGWNRVMADAKAVAGAGAFAMVIEGTIEALAREITEIISIPTIGIGASPACDGQILVTEDALGLFSDFTPKFVKRFAELGDEIERAAKAYAGEVQDRSFPGLEHCFGVTKDKKD
ncbi:MAG: 3-methyl-2-oxobutanoate hydroxymethyltransferase [Proteobacteria bacterium]|nr:3-methyl-2-oxobutanoate hydroxymethyltransferase [Pseudomonadota bacterium]